MQVFVAFNVSNPEGIRTRIEHEYKMNYYDDGTTFFIATKGETTREVATKIGLGEEPVASGIVLPVTSYWGTYNPEVWEWIGAKTNAS